MKFLRIFTYSCFLLTAMSLHTTQTGFFADLGTAVKDTGQAIKSWGTVNVRICKTVCKTACNTGLYVAKRVIVYGPCYIGSKLLLDRYIPENYTMKLIFPHELSAQIFSEAIYTYLLEHAPNKYINLAAICAWSIEKQAFHSYICSHPESYISRRYRNFILQPGPILLASTIIAGLVGQQVNKTLIQMVIS